MTEDQLTPWFPGHIQPERLGVYQTGEQSFASWYASANGPAWSKDCPTIEEAELEVLFGSSEPRNGVERWRGLSECPQPDLFASN